MPLLTALQVCATAWKHSEGVSVMGLALAEIHGGTVRSYLALPLLTGFGVTSM